MWSSPCPIDLNPVALGNPVLIYRLIFKAAAQTLIEFGRNPRWLGGDLGITMVLHTWGQNLGQDIQVHCIVTGGALSPDQQSWIAHARKALLFATGRSLEGLPREVSRLPHTMPIARASCVCSAAMVSTAAAPSNV